MRTRKSFSDLGLVGGGGCGSDPAQKGLEKGEVLTSNNVVVALSIKAEEEECPEVFGPASLVKTVGGNALAYPQKPHTERVMSITIETAHAEEGRKLSELELGGGAVNGCSVESHHMKQS